MVLQLDRDTFLDEYFDYRPGEHLNAIAPTGAGKTHVVYQCAQVAMRQNPQLDFVSLMPKPNSPGTVHWAHVLGLKETASWPPERWPWQDKPAGYVLWPKHRKDIPVEENRMQVAAHLRKALAEQYWKGSSIVFADDIYVTAVLMGLNPECEEYWTAGREGGAALWSANQKPSGTLGGGAVSSFSYNAPTHLFLGKDTDERNIRRFGEIGGGIDPRQIESIVRDLRLYRIGQQSVSELLYLDKRGPYLARIGP
ncbi:MAG TPA: hypothetical protein VN870_00745 [Streptosporangiaceae bacterium]|nr:hypothetical protein [Streptosporangiaceae bacterium]